MARDVASIASELAINFGTEPLMRVEVDWDGSTTSYSDKGANGKILSLSGLDAIVKVGSTGSSGQIDVTLDDTDGSIKALLNINDIHKKPARVYQTFEGVGQGALLFSGQVSSPIEWDEGSRQISFTIVNIIEDRQLGFAPEDGEFDFVAEKAIGVVWPLAFGDVVRVPAVKITEGIRGTSLTRYGQITLPELTQLCALATASQQAETNKKIGDILAGFTDSNYSIVIDNFTSATINLNEFLAALIFDSPTQETNLNSYVATCKELERQRVTSEEQAGKLAQAEQDLIPLESTPGKPERSIFKFFSGKVVRNPQPKLSVEFSPEVQDAYRVRKKIPSFTVVIRGPLPEIVGLPEQTQLALAAFIAANYPYTTQLQWDQDAVLHQAVVSTGADLNNALADKSTAEQLLNLASTSISTLNTVKTNLEDNLLQIVLLTISVDGGEKFPQAVPSEIIINGMHFRGSFAGRVFTISEANTPADVGVETTTDPLENRFKLVDPTVRLKGKYLLYNNAVTFCENQNNGVCSATPLLYTKGQDVVSGSLSHPVYNVRNLAQTIAQTSVFLSRAWIDQIRASGDPDFATGLSFARQRDYGIEVGDTVYLASDYKDIYIANLIASTVIHEVMAIRVINGERKLVPVPSEYYQINLAEDIAGQVATTLRFHLPITEYPDESWEDDIFVSLTSSIGPNTVDIIEHLVDTYTDLVKDVTSFTAVRSTLDPFPSSFAFLDKRGTLKAIEDIAWQARSVAFVKEQTIFLKYLAASEAPIATVDESIVDRRTLLLTMTRTEDLVTEFCALWDSDYARSQEERRNQIVFRNNIVPYGTNQETFDFFIYNIQSLVVKSASFWLIRYSNTWKIAKFKTPLSMLVLETNDTVLLDFADNFIASEPVPGIVEEVTYNSDTFELEFSVKTGVRSGRLLPYSLFWPATPTGEIIYPTSEDIWAGS